MSFVKWVSLSSLGAVVLVGGLYLTIPRTLEGDVSPPVVAAKGDYSRTLYGVPKLKMDHYRLTEDEYFDLQIDGALNVGRVDPAELPLWKERVDKLKAATSTKKGAKNAYAKNEKLQTLIASVIEVKKAEESVDEVQKAADEASKKAEGTTTPNGEGVTNNGTTVPTDGTQATGTQATDGTQATGATTDAQTTGNGATGTAGTTGTASTGTQATDGSVQGTSTNGAGVNQGAVQGQGTTGVDGTAGTTGTDGTSGTVNMGETKNVTTGAPSSGK